MTILMMALATWRISSMLADEDEKGPADLLVKIRKLALRINANLHEGLTCYACNSVWIGTAFAVLYFWLGDKAIYLALPFALSTAAVFVEGYVRQG